MKLQTPRVKIATTPQAGTRTYLLGAAVQAGQAGDVTTASAAAQAARGVTASPR